MASSKPAMRPLLGRREHRKQITKQGLLAAGRRLFGERGLYESRIEDLARQAGIAKGTLYGYFGNKEALVEAVVASGFSELLGYVRREAQGTRTRAEGLARVAEAHLEFFDENQDLMRILHQVRGLLKFNRPGSLRLRRVLRHYLAGLAHVLAQHHPRRGSDGREHVAAATLLFGAVSGISSTRAALAGSIRDQSQATTRALVALVLGFGDRKTTASPQSGQTKYRMKTV